MENMSRIKLKEKEIILLGTAHVSSLSVDQVREVIRSENPDRVCIELDAARYGSIVQSEKWKNLDVIKILKEKKGFLLLANLVLSAFQRRLGINLGVKAGAEMIEAVKIAKEEDIPFSLCDRDIQITFRRAWYKSSFWSKNKLLAVMLSMIFTREKLEQAEIEKMKQMDALEGMMEELSRFLPSIKEVFIDERDRYLAAKIYEAPGSKLVAVIGAGHMPGIIRHLERMESENKSEDVAFLEQVPSRGRVIKILPWIIPALILGLLVIGFFRKGISISLSMLWLWILVNGSLSALGALLAFAHPLTILIAFIASPITSMNPTIGVGIFTGVLEATLKKPRVIDFENLYQDITTFRGFFRNRFTHIFIVFFLSSLGSSIGTFIAIPFLTSLLF